jgi:hypothetical protein
MLYFRVICRGLLASVFAFLSVAAVGCLKLLDAAILREGDVHHILSAQYELAVASVGIVAGAFAVTAEAAHKLLGWLLLVLLGGILLIAVMPAIPYGVGLAFDQKTIEDEARNLFDIWDWFTLWGPNIVGVTLIVVAAVGVQWAEQRNPRPEP